MTLIPAYGRDYKSKKEVLASFDANKDFIMVDMGQYQAINKEQITPGTSITFRYKQHRSCFVHHVV